jgi:hypothetical protein
MSFEIHSEDGERMIANLSFSAGRRGSLHIAISDRAAYLPRRKFFAVSDPNYCERVPLNRVVQATVRKLNPFFLWALALVMVFAGSVTTALMMMPIVRGQGGTVSGYPPAIVVVGLIIPFIARRRYGLTISIVDNGFSWKPPLLVDGASRKAVGSFLSHVADACRNAGITVRDERENSASPIEGVVRSNGYPTAELYSEATKTKGIRRLCYHCGVALIISRWEDWNGFLLKCPNCGQLHGKSWNAYRTVLASVFLNALSFFLTMRRKQALLCFVVFAILLAGLSVALERGRLSGASELVLLGVSFLGPFAINSMLLLRHETALKSALAVSHQLTE